MLLAGRSTILNIAPLHDDVLHQSSKRSWVVRLLGVAGRPLSTREARVHRGSDGGQPSWRGNGEGFVARTRVDLVACYQFLPLSCTPHFHSSPEWLGPTVCVLLTSENETEKELHLNSGFQSSHFHRWGSHYWTELLMWRIHILPWFFQHWMLTLTSRRWVTVFNVVNSSSYCPWWRSIWL